MNGSPHISTADAIRAFLGLWGCVSDADVAIWEAVLGSSEDRLMSAFSKWLSVSSDKPMPKDILAMTTPKPTMRQIIDVCAAEAGLTVSEMRSRDRTHRISHPRQDAMVRMSEAGFTLQQIAKALGGMDHTTVLHGIRASRARGSA